MILVEFLYESLVLGLDADPWLLLGLVAEGLIRALLPEALLKDWIGGDGTRAILRATVLGAPMPLCSCGAIPTAVALHRSGAARGPATAFLVATPGIGADSVAITHALLGPVMMAARVLGALATAIATAFLVAGRRGGAARPSSGGAACLSGGGCGTSSCGKTDGDAAPKEPVGARLRAGMAFAFDDLFKDIGGWILVGLLVAGAIIWAVPPQSFADKATGLQAMLLMAVIGIPIYVCATAATPVAAAMLVAGASPGTVVVFLLAGPITSLATLGVLRREMGNGALLRYLVGVLGTTIVVGLTTDAVIGQTGLDVAASVAVGRDILPSSIEWGALAVLALVAVRPAGRRLARAATVTRPNP